MGEATVEETLGVEELVEAWPVLDAADRAAHFRRLVPERAAAFFQTLSSRSQAGVLARLDPAERTRWIRTLAPDDAADVIQHAPEGRRAEWLGLLDDRVRAEVKTLTAYPRTEAGGLMSPRFATLEAAMTVDEAVAAIRRQARQNLETLYYAYVLDDAQHLRGVVSFRELLLASGAARVRDVMRKTLVSVTEDTHQEEVARELARHDLVALPVLDGEERMRGIVTFDDIVDVVDEEATRDMHRVGGLEALEAPYMRTGLFTLLRKRAGWLSLLFLGEMLTATAMGHYETEIARAVVLALFIPLIISSGGNSGSQATTLVIRAMALGELRLADWWRVMRREFLSGLVLGAILACIGLVRIFAWQGFFHAYGAHVGLLATTVALSLVGVVCWGTLAGSLLPFLLRRLGFDPASASAPLVATLVDVSGLVIYFSVANVVLRGALL